MGPSSEYYELALYKLGWSLYKQEFYDLALDQFMTLLDYKLLTGYDFDIANADEEEEERRATKTSAFRRSYEVVAENRRLDLAPTGFARRAYQLRHGDIVIGGMAPDGFFRRSADVAFPGDLHLATRIFLAFLVLVQWRRTARSRNS
jgi:hypothetical protein